MKNSTIVRKIDTLGRVVIPKEIRRTFNLHSDDEVEFTTDDNTIYLRSYKPLCTFCYTSDNIIDFRGKKVCRSCAKELLNEI